MALQERHRTRFYAHLVEHIDEETAEAVLGQFPARDLDEPVSREFVALQTAELRTEISALRADLGTEIAALRIEMAELELRLIDRINDQSDRLLKRLQLEGALAVIVLAVVNAFVG